MWIQNVPVCTGTTRTCVTTCARGAGTHGDVLNLHTEAFLNVHTEAFLNVHTGTPQLTFGRMPREKERQRKRDKTRKEKKREDKTRKEKTIQ